MNNLPMKTENFMQHIGKPLAKELPELVLQWFREEVVGRSHHTLYARKLDLSKFVLFYKNLNGHVDGSQLAPADVKLFIKHMESLGYAHTSINRHLGSIRAFSTWLLQEGVTRKHACKGIKEFNVQPGLPVAPRDREFHRLRKAADSLAGGARYVYSQDFRNMVILEALNASGLRISELLSIELTQFHGKKLHDVVCKGGKVRTISIKTEVVRLIEEYIKHHRTPGSNYLFTSKSGAKLDRVSAWKALKAIARYASANLPKGEEVDVWPHAIRHKHAYDCRRAKDPVFAAKRLGHVNLNYIDRYSGETVEEEREIIEGLD